MAERSPETVVMGVWVDSIFLSDGHATKLSPSTISIKLIKLILSSLLWKLNLKLLPLHTSPHCFGSESLFFHLQKRDEQLLPLSLFPTIFEKD
ncbi:hypothetical protein GQ457_12G023120 [Hibiscus cannabinus]